VKIAYGLSKALAWLKAHWQIPVLVAWSVAIWIFARRDYNTALKVIDAKKKSYEEQIKSLRDSHNREMLKRDRLLEEFNLAISKVEVEFEKREKVLEEKHVRVVREVVVKSKKDPSLIRERIEKEFGFTYVE
jgi:hypothetical protein